MDSGATVHDLTDDRYQLIEQGPASTVSRTWSSFDGQEPQWIVAKSATTRKKFSKEPHDIVKELRILCKLSQTNVIPVLSHFKDTAASMLTIYLPYIPFSLAQLIDSPSFSPFSAPPSSPTLDPRQEACMLILAKSITFQMLCALAYLHDPARQITHRDIKPANLLLTPEGRVVFIDFGIAREEATASGGHGDLWPEPAGQMYFEVSTGPYRAPELLFGTRAYDAVAIDMWSVGTVLAEMFAALRLCSDYADDEDDEEPASSAQPNDPPFVVPPRLHVGQPDTRWARDTLFNGRRGEIGLAWSIFKVRGTPTRESWRAFADLPGAASVEFKVVPRVPLRSFLPNLPPKEEEEEAALVLELLEGLLAYPPPQRLRAGDALNQAWFGGRIVLPPGYVDDRTKDDERVVFELDGEVLADFVGRILS
ncbi:kinase-like domain-containing protein [Mycena alexandri]|uniref:cyclin-dependent kinase n=1 Tax=Mycena alexandri TaxID=1745969 RepID=A0AAD6TEP6_9AGAR|nr:kinase-like domain-containing protein [Mycena alexandri]